MHLVKSFIHRSLLLSLTISSCVFHACGTPSAVIAVIPRTTARMYWEAEHAGAELAARQYGAQIRWNAPTRDDDLQMQIEMVDQAVSGRCRGLILAPDEPRAMMVPVERALAAGVPTVVVGAGLSLPPQKNLAYIVNDDAMIGSMAAARVGEVLHGKGEVVIIGIDPQSLASLEVLRSFISSIQTHYPDIAVVDRRPNTTNDLESELIVSQALMSHPGTNAIFSLDEIGTYGAFLALKSRSLTGKVQVIGVRQSDELINALRMHEIDALIAENTYQMGFQAVQLLVHGLPQATQTVKLPPLLITAANVDAPATKLYVTNRWNGDLQ